MCYVRFLLWDTELLVFGLLFGTSSRREKHGAYKLSDDHTHQGSAVKARVWRSGQTRGGERNCARVFGVPLLVKPHQYLVFIVDNCGHMSKMSAEQSSSLCVVFLCIDIIAKRATAVVCSSAALSVGFDRVLLRSSSQTAVVWCQENASTARRTRSRPSIPCIASKRCEARLLCLHNRQQSTRRSRALEYHKMCSTSHTLSYTYLYSGGAPRRKRTGATKPSNATERVHDGIALPVLLSLLSNSIRSALDTQRVDPMRLGLLLLQTIYSNINTVLYVHSPSFC